ncbi:10056_t:CDS:2 [Acaulospora colombiana]|uniref:10056_t:CDS:1 n=1 Tax=Acaulospora colombiana TaxID=27376 RepID=A0ACA9NLU0_9GLOM|nr:10056_t:CDS:2 [Acaulospora colombiana]
MRAAVPEEIWTGVPPAKSRPPRMNDVWRPAVLAGDGVVDGESKAQVVSRVIALTTRLGTSTPNFNSISRDIRAIMGLGELSVVIGCNDAFEASKSIS